jgi:hypothetical protein
MLLTKLKIVAWVAVVSLSVGAAALAQTYRGNGQESRAEPARAARDEVQALRLELEALRLDLKVTRERVRILEDAAKSPPRAEMTGPGGASGMPTNAAISAGIAMPGGGPTKNRAATVGDPDNSKEARNAEREYLSQFFQQIAQGQKRQASAEDQYRSAIAQAEAALKKLREAPMDQQAVESLGRALQQFQARKAATGEESKR